MEQTGIAGPCIARPVLFFTLAGQNLRSERVLTELCGTIREKHPGIPQPECMVFSTPEIVNKYFREGGIDTKCAVGLFDVQYCSGKYFFPLLKGKRKKGIVVPDWCPAHWAIAVSAGIDTHGIRSAAYQITADFIKRFQGQLAQNTLPWGDPPTAVRSGRQRRKLRKERRAVGLREFAYAWSE